MADAEYVQVSQPLDPGDRLVLYTDGISEAMNDETSSTASSGCTSSWRVGPAGVAAHGRQHPRQREAVRRQAIAERRHVPGVLGRRVEVCRVGWDTRRLACAYRSGRRLRTSPCAIRIAGSLTRLTQAARSGQRAQGRLGLTLRRQAGRHGENRAAGRPRTGSRTRPGCPAWPASAAHSGPPRPAAAPRLHDTGRKSIFCRAWGSAPSALGTLKPDQQRQAQQAPVVQLPAQLHLAARQRAAGGSSRSSSPG